MAVEMTSVRATVVVPVYRAEMHIGEVIDRLDGWLHVHPEIDVVLVDDASPDATWSRLQEFATARDRVLAIRLRDRVGQVGATLAGFVRATGSTIVMADDDLESDPEHLIDLVAAVEAGADFASGNRTGRRAMVRGAGSRVFNARLRRRGLPFHDAGCGTNAMTPAVASALVELGWDARQYHFKPAVANLTDRVVNVDIPSSAGAPSRYSVVGLAAAWLDLELQQGWIGRRHVVAAGFVAPVLLAGAMALRAARSVRAMRYVCVAAAFASLVPAAVAMRVLDVRTRQRRSIRNRPPWSVVEEARQPSVTTVDSAAVR